ncbi:MAG TPA: hypothetical protein VF796_26825 [Humisphaera sp.]
MITNATLLRIDPPPPAPAAPAGPPTDVRCAFCAPAATGLRWLSAARLSASAVLYLPLTDVGGVSPGGRAWVRLDGHSAAAEWAVVHVAPRVGEVLRYVQVYLAPAG